VCTIEECQRFACGLPVSVAVVGITSIEEINEALGKIGSAATEAVPALNTALNDKDGHVRRCAKEALRRIGLMTTASP
jgi:HEAT repeat protein